MKLEGVCSSQYHMSWRGSEEGVQELKWSMKSPQNKIVKTPLQVSHTEEKLLKTESKWSRAGTIGTKEEESPDKCGGGEWN